MARKLVNICLAWAIVLGCWGGVVAAVACPHVGCETAVTAPDHGGLHGGDVSHDAASAEETSAHPADHHGHSAESRPAEQAQPGLVTSVAGDSGAHDSRCSHCVGRPDTPPSSKFERQPAPVGKDGKVPAALASPKVAAPAASHALRIKPAQHAPPGSQDRHLLLGVFRI